MGEPLCRPSTHGAATGRLRPGALGISVQLAPAEAAGLHCPRMVTQRSPDWAGRHWTALGGQIGPTIDPKCLIRWWAHQQPQNTFTLLIFIKKLIRPKEGDALFASLPPGLSPGIRMKTHPVVDRLTKS